MGSTWNNTSNLYVGNSGSGTLIVLAGGAVNNKIGYIGYTSGSTGTVNVDGTGSTWAVSSDLFVGESGSGTLNISGGSTVAVTGGTYAAHGAGSQGAINFGAGGGTLATNLLMVSSSQLTGAGTINTKGLASDADLTFDATHDLTQTFPINQVTVNLSLSASSYLGIGYYATGSLAIRDGKKVTVQTGCIGFKGGSTGVVNVDGAVRHGPTVIPCWSAIPATGR